STTRSARSCPRRTSTTERSPTAESGRREKPLSAPSGEECDSLGGDPVDLCADIAELLPGHRPGLYPGRDALGDNRRLEVSQGDPPRQAGQTGAGPCGRA